MTSYQKLKQEIERLNKHIRVLVMDGETTPEGQRLITLYKQRYDTEYAIMFGNKNKRAN